MAETSNNAQPSGGVAPRTNAFNNDVPKPEDFYLAPVELVKCLIEIGPKIKATGAWWSLIGDLGENLIGVYVRPTEVEIVTDAAGLEKIYSAMSEYGPAPIQVKERRLERAAELDGKSYPITERSSYTEFSVNGAKVKLHGEYQLKVGDWEWGDTFLFEPTVVYVATAQIPVMPLRLGSEQYIILGWTDRAKLLSDSYTREHAMLNLAKGAT